MCKTTSYDAVQLVLVFVLLSPQSQQVHDLLLRRAALLQLLQTLAVDLSPRQVLKQFIQRYGGESQRGERLVDGLLTQGDVWRWTDRQTDRQWDRELYDWKLRFFHINRKEGKLLWPHCFLFPITCYSCSSNEYWSVIAACT